jgi:HD superfamily phosphohydrolase YqeK
MPTPAQLRTKFDKALVYIERDGIDELVTWLEDKTDFFMAPASTRFHGNYDGGLLEHSLHVVEFALTNFNYLIKYKPELESIKESVIIAALFHDVCKVNQYHWGAEKFTKKEDDSGRERWATYKTYSFEDELPMGHGEKSVYYVSQHMKLTNSEILAIRWHMSTTEVGTQIDGLTKYAYQQAFDDPLVKIIAASDQLSTAIADTIDYKSQARII